MRKLESVEEESEDLRLFVVTKSEDQCQNEKEVYEILKKKWPTFYGEVKVDNTTVSTKEGKIFTLTSIPKVVDALRALKEQLHDNDIVHGDLKPKHIRQTAQLKPYFIDFGFSIVIPKDDANKNLQPVKGFTTQWASLDSIVRHTAHELDDYEAIFMIALFDTVALLDKEDPNTQWLPLPPLPVKPQLKSKKTWAAWKLQLMEQVFAFHCALSQQARALLRTLSWIAGKLLLVWTTPRSAARLSNDEIANLRNHEDEESKPFDLRAHAQKVRTLFSEHLGRPADPLDSPRLDDPQTKSEVEHGGQMFAAKAVARNTNKEDGDGCCKVTVCHQAALRKERSVRASEDDAKNSEVPETKQEDGADGAIDDCCWAEYDTLLVFTNDTFQAKQGRAWDYGEEKEWDFFGKGDEFGVKLVKAIGGKYLCLETSDKTHIAGFLAKFERFVLEYSLRPLDVLLLVIGIVIECHKQPFFPQHFRTMVDCVQHSDWKCAGLDCSECLHTPGEVFYYCKCGSVFCSPCSEKHSFTQHAGGEESLVHNCQHKTVQKDLLPNLSLFVLLLAGRVCVTNKITTTNTGRASSNAISTDLRLETEDVRRKLAAAEKKIAEMEIQLAAALAAAEKAEKAAAGREKAAAEREKAESEKAEKVVEAQKEVGGEANEEQQAEVEASQAEPSRKRQDKHERGALETT